ncbi:unnamed protein product, partial [marine sediment metagenome]
FQYKCTSQSTVVGVLMITSDGGFQFDTEKDFVWYVVYENLGIYKEGVRINYIL